VKLPLRFKTFAVISRRLILAGFGAAEWTGSADLDFWKPARPEGRNRFAKTPSSRNCQIHRRSNVLRRIAIKGRRSVAGLVGAPHQS